MIKAISFDFYNTLVRFWPPLDEIQHSACRELGLNLDIEKVERGYLVADVYFNEENGRQPLADRTEEDRLAFFSRYEQILLENAGLPVSLDLAKNIWQMAMTVPKDFIAFDDTLPALESLKSQGYRLGVLSNLRRDMGPLCKKLGISQYLDFCINSAEAGAEKPHAPIFLAALKRVSVEPGEAVHVGDQYHSDVLGARGVGIHPVLIDRGGWQTDVDDCPKISSLSDLESLLKGAPDSLS
ncbi:MAG: HAD family hydrolase [Chloroflexi bacterium]|nr:HAD family hydrolase [Chloroflexota bacterium]